MKAISIYDFCQIHASVRFINSLRQYWCRRWHFSCLGAPKKQNILVYFRDCTGTVHTKSGEEIKIEENGIMYAPQGAEYTLDLRSEIRCSTIGVNFLLFGEHAESVVFSQDVQCFSPNTAAQRAFERLAHSETLSALQCRILLETIISEIAQVQSMPTVPPVIQPSVTYLLDHYTESPSVTELAAQSHISEVYFRRVFKSVFSMSPAAYMTQLRLKKATEYLEYGEMSVQEIADAVGYAGAAYFSKEFKAMYGVTPLRYRKEKCSAT